MARPLTEGERRNLMVEQSTLTALSQHPGWATLVAAVERHQRELEATVIARALYSTKKMSPEEQAYYQGVIFGMNWFLKPPRTAETRLARLLRRSGSPMEEEDEDAA